MKYCAWCGKQLGDDDVFCGFCGKRADGSDAAVPQQNPPPARPAQPVPPVQPAAPQQPAPQGQWQPTQAPQGQRQQPQAPQGQWQPTQAPQGQWQQPRSGAWQQPPAGQAPPPQRPPQWQPPAAQHVAPRSGGGKTGLIIGIVALVLVIAVGVGGFVWPGFFRNGKETGGGTVNKPKTEQAVAPKATKTPAETAAPEKTEVPKETEAPKPVATPEPTPEPAPEPTPEPTEPPFVTSFTDVKAGEWYYDAICWAEKNGIVSGTEFKPADATNRGQALTFLWRAAGEPAPKLKVSPYSDVSEGDWFYKPVLWGFENGLISAAGDGQFHADGTLTRAQAITFLCRALDGKPAGRERSFSDVPEGAWYFDTANWALEQGIVGRGSTWFFQPDATVTRAQFVTFMHRAYDPDAKKADGSAPAQAGFRELGIGEDVDDHGRKTFQTFCDNGDAVTFDIEVDSYRVFEDDDAFPKQEGREYRIMTLHMWTKNTDTKRTYLLSLLESDSYNIALFSDSKVEDDTGLETHTVLVNGVPTDMTVWWRSSSENKDGYHHVYLTFTASVPVGYDGLVVGMRNRNIDTAGLYLNDYYTSETDFALYRMK